MFAETAVDLVAWPSIITDECPAAESLLAHMDLRGVLVTPVKMYAWLISKRLALCPWLSEAFASS